MPAIIGTEKKFPGFDVQEILDKLGQGMDSGELVTIGGLPHAHVPQFDADRLSHYRKMEQDVSNFAQFPLQYTTRNDLINNMMFLAGQFAGYLEQMMEAGQTACLDDVPVPLEITPHYVCLLVHYTRNSDLKAQIEMHGALRGIAANQNFMDDMPHHIRNYYCDRSGLLDTDTGGLPVFLYEWRLCNRYMEPIPLGNFGAVSVIEMVRATPKRVKEFLQWHKHMEDRTATYPLTAVDCEKVVQGIKIKPTKVSSIPLSDKMFKVIGAANRRNADELLDNQVMAMETLWAGYSKYLLNSLTCGLTSILASNISLDKVIGITTAFERLVGDFPYFELLDGCQEATVSNLQMSELAS